MKKRILGKIAFMLAPSSTYSSLREPKPTIVPG